MLSTCHFSDYQPINKKRVNNVKIKVKTNKNDCLSLDLFLVTKWKQIKYSKQKIGIVIVPVAFVSEHSETLVELDIEYQKLAKENGCSFYKRAPALGVEENFIKGLTELVLKKETRGKFVSSLMCPSNYKKCPCLELKN